MAIDVARVVQVALEAATQGPASDVEAKTPKRRLPGSRALLLGAGLVTVGRLAAPKGRELLGSLQQSLGESESNPEDEGQEIDDYYDDEPEGEADEDFEEEEDYDDEPEGEADEDFEEDEDSEEDEDYDDEPEGESAEDFDEEEEADDEEDEEEDERPRPRRQARTRARSRS